MQNTGTDEFMKWKGSEVVLVEDAGEWKKRPFGSRRGKTLVIWT